MTAPGNEAPPASLLGDGLPAQLTKGTAVLAVVAVLLLAQSARVLLQWYRLSHVPGPFWAAFSKWWMVKQSLKGRQPMAIKDVTDKYGALPTHLLPV
jgi:hypothetical protein